GSRAGARRKVLFGGKAGYGGARGGGVEQHRHGAGSQVRDGQIEHRMRVEIGNSEGYRGGGRGEVVFGGEAGDGGGRGGGGEQHRHGAGTKVRDGQIEPAVKVRTAPLDG